jgi:hypothetical protein
MTTPAGRARTAPDSFWTKLRATGILEAKKFWGLTFGFAGWKLPAGTDRSAVRKTGP